LSNNKSLEDPEEKRQGEQTKTINEEPSQHEILGKQTAAEQKFSQASQLQHKGCSSPTPGNQTGRMKEDSMQETNGSSDLGDNAHDFHEETLSPANHEPKDAVTRSSSVEEITTLEVIDRQTKSQNASRDTVPASVHVKSPLLAETRKSGGFFSRLIGFLGRSADANSTSPKAAATASGIPGSTMEARDSESPEHLKESKTTPQDKIRLSSTSQDLSWTSSISCRKLTEPIPIESTIFGASAIRPPSLGIIMPLTNLSSRLSSSAFASQLARYPPSSPATIAAWVSHYKKELYLHKPDKVDSSELARLYSAWLRIQSWSDDTSEESVRLAAQMVLTKAHEHISRQKELNEWQNERIAAEKMEEQTVFEDVLGGNGRLSYPLTAKFGSSSQAEEGRAVESKAASAIKLNGDTRIVPADTGAASITTPAPSKNADDQASIRELALELPKDDVPPKENRQAINVTLPPSIQQQTSHHSEGTMNSRFSPSLAFIQTNSKEHTTNIDP
jgi:hypothetical protein